jgi:hypothetical protein
MSRKSDEPGHYKMIFGAIRRSRKTDGRPADRTDRIKYLAVSLVFSAVLAFVFDRTLDELHEVGGNLSGAMEGMFTLLITLVFAIVGVYLIVLVLHPHFKKMPVPASFKKISDRITDDITKEDLVEMVRSLETDEEVEAYINTFGVKADIALTLSISLVAFFFGVYGYAKAYTIEYNSDPNILLVSLCFMFMVFACIYTILKTMKVVWDV